MSDAISGYLRLMTFFPIDVARLRNRPHFTYHGPVAMSG